jgi:histidinol-phosphate aminotransferase
MSDKRQLTDPSMLVRRSVATSHTYTVPAYQGITVKLNQNECPFDLPEGVKRDLVERLVAEPWNRYPDEFDAHLRSVIAEGVGWDPDGVLLGNGSNELAQFLGFTLIERGAPVALLDPMFSLFQKIVELHEGRPFPIACSPDLTTDPERCVDVASGCKASLTIVATPNNPTGRSIPFEGLRSIAERTSGILLIDEAYHEFVEGPTAVELLDAHRNVVVMRTLSKTVGLAGLRLGYLLADPAFVAEILKARLPFMINRLSSVVAEYMFRNPEIVGERVEILKAGRDQLLDELSAIEGVEAVPSDANFIIFQTGRPAEWITDQLAQRGVLIRNVSGYAVLNGFVRVNVGLPPENKAFLSALKDVLSST